MSEQKRRGRPPGSKNKPKVLGVDNTKPTTRKGSPLLYKGMPSLNPAGRPKGSRNKLSESFIARLYAHFEEYGPSAIDAVYSESPVDYLKVIASVVPKQFGLEEGTQNAFVECWRAISEGRA